VNGRRLNRVSYLVDEGDRITVKASERSQKHVRAALATAE